MRIDARDGPLPAPALSASVFLLSASILAFEVLLLRLFAIRTFHHFAHMVVGVALLGFAASGTALVLLRRRIRGREASLFRLLVALSVPALLLAPLAAGVVDFEPARLLWDPGAWVAVGVLYLVLALPFLLGGGAVAVALQEGGEGVGRIYAWNLAGSGVGGALAIVLLFLLPPHRALAAAALPGGAAAGLALLAGRRTVPRGALTVLLLLAPLAAVLRPPGDIEVSPFKQLPQVEAYPDAARVGVRSDPTGWAVAVEAAPFHHAPGLSLDYRGRIPPQVGLFVDGAVAGAATRWRGDTASLSFLRSMPSWAPYAVGSPRRVLVVGSGGGLPVLSALLGGAREVTAVELVTPLLRLADAVVDPSSRVYADPRVRTVAGDARSFAAGARGSYDLVVLPASAGFATTVSGAHAIAENHLDTVEGYRAFLDLLAPGGMLVVSRWVRAPPRDNVKAILTAGEALRSGGVGDVGGALATVRSWADAVVLVKPDGFREEEIGSLRRFADGRRFDIDWPPAAAPDSAYHALERPALREAARAAATGPGAARAYATDHPFHVAPATDDRPYFGRFLRAGDLGRLLGRRRGDWAPFAEWGYLAVLATLLQGGLLSLLLGVPAATTLRGRGREGGTWSVALYFGAVGLGFIFLEIAAIQKLSLLLGHPVYATAAAVTAILCFSGVGSALSDRLPAGRAPAACIAVGAVALLAAALLPGASAVLGLPLPVRGAGALLCVGAVGVLMGGPFPLGLRALAPEHADVAWAWAANGVGSVTGSALAALLALELGGREVVVAGGLLYLVAAAVAGTGPGGARRREARTRGGPTGGAGSGDREGGPVKARPGSVDSS